ncbi:PTS system IIA component (Glc family) [Breznakia blatticola]|uniref:PTS system IIA component (Glc family) n=1 Tax=Breznakia blatticola TaxID=1754012 RepID=A0A4R8ABH0_9FIRM|nr:PTS glucose transporter subunit IIA [Breznakia blatticola]TDW25797.1 PTS system IIA component (Glc family) [Breznakia blatticola]
MSLLKKLGKKELQLFADTDVVSPVNGEIIPASEINDGVFAQEMMGQTIGIIPSDGTVVSPVNGTIVALYPTGHAFGIMGKNGNGYLIHIGINTSSMNGKGFKCFVQQGDEVAAGQKIIDVDLSEVKKEGHDTTIMIIVTDKAKDDYKIDFIDPTIVERANKINK